MASRLGRVATATGVIGGAIVVSGGSPAIAADPPRCIDAIQSTGTPSDLGQWDEFTDGCVGDFGVGKLVINVLDKATGLPVDGTVDLTKLLNAFQFGYGGYAYGSPQAGRLDPYCDLRWAEPGDKGDLIFNVASVTEPGEFTFIESGFGGRPLRVLHWLGGTDPSVTPDFEDPLEENQIVFGWACDANYDMLTTPAITDVGGGYELLAGRNTGRLAADGTSDFHMEGGGTLEGLAVGSFQKIDLYVSKRPIVEETTTTISSTTTTTTTTVPVTPTTVPPAAVPPPPPAGVLPETGNETGMLAIAAAFLLAIGAAAIGVSRRRLANR